MPVTDKERDDINKLDDAARNAFIGEQLKRIRIATVNKLSVSGEEIDDALDKIEVAQKRDDHKDKASTPAAHVGETGGPSQNPSTATASNPPPTAPGRPVVPPPGSA